MRWFALLLLLVGCGSAPVGAAPAGPAPASAAPTDPAQAAHDEPRVTLRPAPEVGVMYEILHRESRRVGEGEPVQIDTRTLLQITELRPDGSRAGRAHVRRRYPRGNDASEPLRSGTVSLVLSAEGRLRADPAAECEGTDERRMGRYLRHLFGTRAVVAERVGSGSRWRDELMTDAAELPQRARFTLDELGPSEAEGRLLARVEVEQGDVGGARVTGSGSVRGRFRVGLADGFVGESQLLTTLDGEIYEDGHAREGTVRVQSTVRVRRLDEPEPDALACVGTFDPSVVTRAIRARILAVQACYENRLRVDPSLAGRVMVRFTIEEDGHVSEARVTEDDLGDEGQVGQCVVETISRFQFDPGPEGGSVTFAYPFVFAPQR